MRHGPVIVLLLLGGCSDSQNAGQADAPGARLEATAVAQGLVPDPDAPITGSWSRDTDRVCIVPGEGRDLRIGALVDYGEGQGCAASGTARRSGSRIDVTLGDECRFRARYEGDRIVFPAELPGTCDALCTGRASLAALTVDRVSESVSEAATLRTPSDRALCGS